MSAVLNRPRSSASGDDERTSHQAPGESPAVAIDGRPGSAAFAVLLGAYRSSGGTTRGDDLARLLADHRRGDYVSLARFLVAGDVFGFEWRKTVWISMFQFEPRDLGVKPGLRRILRELAPRCDGWALAAWFVNANARLGGHRPLDLLDGDMPTVLDAARGALREHDARHGN